MIQERRLRFVGHTWRNNDEFEGQTILWKIHGENSNVNKTAFAYGEQLTKDTGLPMENFMKIMDDYKKFKGMLIGIR